MRVINFRRSAIILFALVAPVAWVLFSLPLALVALALAAVALLNVQVEVKRA